MFRQLLGFKLGFVVQTVGALDFNSITNPSTILLNDDRYDIRNQNFTDEHSNAWLKLLDLLAFCERNKVPVNFFNCSFANVSLNAVALVFEQCSFQSVDLNSSKTHFIDSQFVHCTFSNVTESSISNTMVSNSLFDRAENLSVINSTLTHSTFNELIRTFFIRTNLSTSIFNLIQRCVFFLSNLSDFVGYTPNPVIHSTQFTQVNWWQSNFSRVLSNASYNFSDLHIENSSLLNLEANHLSLSQSSISNTTIRDTVIRFDQLVDANFSAVNIVLSTFKVIHRLANTLFVATNFFGTEISGESDLIPLSAQFTACEFHPSSTNSGMIISQVRGFSNSLVIDSLIDWLTVLQTKNSSLHQVLVLGQVEADHSNLTDIYVQGSLVGTYSYLSNLTMHAAYYSQLGFTASFIQGLKTVNNTSGASYVNLVNTTLIDSDFERVLLYLQGGSLINSTWHHYMKVGLEKCALQDLNTSDLTQLTITKANQIDFEKLQLPERCVLKISGDLTSVNISNRHWNNTQFFSFYDYTLIRITNCILTNLSLPFLNISQNEYVREAPCAVMIDNTTQVRNVYIPDADVTGLCIATSRDYLDTCDFSRKTLNQHGFFSNARTRIRDPQCDYVWEISLGVTAGVVLLTLSITAAYILCWCYIQRVNTVYRKNENLLRGSVPDAVSLTEDLPIVSIGPQP